MSATILAQMAEYPEPAPIELWPFLAAAGIAVLALVVLLAIKPIRDRLRFNLRTIFVVLTFLGIWFGWQVNTVHTRRTMRREIDASGGQVESRIGGGNIQIERAGDENYHISTIRRLLGDSAVHQIFFPRLTTAKDMRRASYFPEAEVIGASGAAPDLGFEK
jgi:hypothetical protein